MSSILWESLLAGKDKENGYEAPHPDKEGETVWINSSAYGYENVVNKLAHILGQLQAVPRDVVAVYDGRGAKTLRTSIHPGYKAGRDKSDGAYAEFEKLKERIGNTLADLGALQVWQDGMEADDLLCYLSKNLPETVVVSNDGDMQVLVGGGAHVWWDGKLDANRYGPFPAKFITVYKALVGDSSDKIPGAAGFGPKAWLDLLCVFGEEGLEAMQELIETKTLERLSEDVAQLPALRKIMDSAGQVYMSWACARMYPELVNTMRKPLQIRASVTAAWDPALHDERLKKFYGGRKIVHAGNYEQVSRWALPKLLESPFVAFDIETSTPPESDEWLEAKKKKVNEDTDLGVDVFGSELTSYSLTFGENMQYTLYLPHEHVEAAECPNLTLGQMRQFLELIPSSKNIVVQNASFELTVLYQEWGEKWKANGYRGFLPNMQDTKIMRSYTNENGRSGLKPQSLELLGYTQVSYAEVTGGRKMNQLTAEEAFDYGCDDTICTAALYGYHRFVMELEKTWDVYLAVDVECAYLNALRFVTGTPISLERMNELAKADAEAFDAAWATVRAYLMAKGWEGTACPKFEAVSDFTPIKIKEAYAVVTGRELETKVRTPSKLVALIRAEGEELLAMAVDMAEGGRLEPLNNLIKMHFFGEPLFKSDSPKQMQHLLYTVMGLPERIWNKRTDAMRAAGLMKGSPQTGDLAIQYALMHDQAAGPEVIAVLKALQTMKTTETRRKLYYGPYEFVRHWKDNLVHSNLNQCAARTRRYSSSGPNLTQLPKHPKNGEPAHFREVFVPHKPDAVIVSMDFSGQELRNIADQSQDPDMLSCYVGDNLKDMHLLTAVGIIRKKDPAKLCEWAKVSDLPASVAAACKGAEYTTVARWLLAVGTVEFGIAKEARVLGKKTNFTTEYGAQAPKLAETLLITVEEAQDYIDAKLAAFPRAEAWKQEVIRGLNNKGFTTTMMGARRHLGDVVAGSNRWEISSAERQGVNFKVQGSCAEQTKLAEGRVWASGLLFRYDAIYIGPVHDELVFSVVADQALAFTAELHALMTKPYSTQKVPIVASIAIGKNFGELIECGDEFDAHRIDKALVELGFPQREAVAA